MKNFIQTEGFDSIFDSYICKLVSEEDDTIYLQCVGDDQREANYNCYKEVNEIIEGLIEIKKSLCYNEDDIVPVDWSYSYNNSAHEWKLTNDSCDSVEMTIEEDNCLNSYVCNINDRIYGYGSTENKAKEQCLKKLEREIKLLSKFKELVTINKFLDFKNYIRAVLSDNCVEKVIAFDTGMVIKLTFVLSDKVNVYDVISLSNTLSILQSQRYFEFSIIDKDGLSEIIEELDNNKTDFQIYE